MQITAHGFSELTPFTLNPSAPPMLTDLKYAFRQLLKAPAFTIAALLTLSLGIGACTAIFSVVDSVLLRPLDFPESERLVVVSETRFPQYPEFSVAPGQYFSWKEQAKSFENLASSNCESCTMTGTSSPRRLSVERVTANYFSTFGAHPGFGREFQPEENIPGHDKVIILTHGFWLRQFGGRTDVLNQTVELNGEPHTIIGIMPASFRSGWDTDILAPAAFDASAHEQRGGHYLNVIGRLKNGVTIEQARSELLLIADQLAKDFPVSNKGWSTKIDFMLNTMVSSVQPLLFTLLGAVGFLLLIGCTNVANLLLARAATRGKEIAIRISQGATRARIIRQLLTESVLLATIGGSIGAWVAHWGVRALIWLAPGGLPRSGEIVVSNHALGVACGLILLTGVGFGLAPAVQASRVNLNEALKDGGRGTSAGGRRQRLLSALVITEIAMALALLVGAGLLIRSFAHLQGTNPGFAPSQAVALELNLASPKYATLAEQITFAEQTSAALSTLPGVQSVGAAQVLPFSGGSHFHAFNFADRPPTNVTDWPAANYYAVTPDYFKAMGVPLRSGRFFNEHDSAGSNPVAIINESIAKQFFPGKNPLGAKINITSLPGDNWREIVGVVGDTKHYGLADKVVSQMYEPFLQHPWNDLTFVDAISRIPSVFSRRVRSAHLRRHGAALSYHCRLRLFASRLSRHAGKSADRVANGVGNKVKGKRKK